MGNHGRWKIKPKLTRVISLSENGKSTVPTGPTGPNMAWHGQIPVVKSPFLGEISFIPSVKRPPRMDHWDFVPSPVSSTESVSFFNFSACGDKPHIGKGECYATRISSTVVHRHGTSCKVLAPSKKPLRISLTVVQHNKKAGWTVEPPPWIHRKNSLDKLKRVWQPKWWFNQRNLLLQTAKQPGIYRNQATKWSRVWLSMANIIDKIRDSELLQKKNMMAIFSISPKQHWDTSWNPNSPCHLSMGKWGWSWSWWSWSDSGDFGTIFNRETHMTQHGHCLCVHLFFHLSDSFLHLLEIGAAKSYEPISRRFQMEHQPFPWAGSSSIFRCVSTHCIPLLLFLDFFSKVYIDPHYWNGKKKRHPHPRFQHLRRSGLHQPPPFCRPGVEFHGGFHKWRYP